MEDTFIREILFPWPNETYLKKYNYKGDQIILSIFTIFFCIVGLVGNGNIIWLLGSHIRRKPFAIFILNLAVADFGSLLFLLPITLCLYLPTFEECIDIPHFLYLFLVSLHRLMDTSSRFFLTSISMDRCMSVLFPNWYRCHQSHMLYTMVCVMIWALSFGLNGVPLFQAFFGDDFEPGYYLFGFEVKWMICLLLVTISTLTVFIKVCFKSQPCQCGNLLKVILLMLSSFLLFTILSAGWWIFMEFVPPAYFDLWTSLMSSVNPLIYFLAGRLSGGKFLERMKATLQRVFREETDIRMELQLRAQTLP